MALAFVQAQGNTATGATAVTVTISTTPGNLIVGLMREGSNAISTLAVTDSTGGISNFC